MTWGSWSLLASFALIGLGMVYGLGRWGWSGYRARLAATAEVLGVASLLLVWAPWLGWPHVFAATALGLVVEHRRRKGSWTAAVALAGVQAGFVFVVATLLYLFT